MRGLSGRSPSRSLALTAAVLLTAAVGVLPAAADTGPVMTLTPAPPPVTDVPCVLLLGGTTVGDCVLTGSGDLSGSLTVPAGTAPGPQLVQARSAGGDGTATLQVLPAVFTVPSFLATVPDVRHLTVRSARARLGLVDLRLSGGGTRPDRRVASQSPAPGTRIRPGGIVAVALAKGPTKGRHPSPSAGFAGHGPSPSGTAVVSVPPPARTLVVTLAVAGLLLLLVILGGIAAALHRRGPTRPAHSTRRPTVAVRLLARPDAGALVRSVQTAVPGPTLMLAARPDLTFTVNADATADATDDAIADVTPHVVLERTC